MSEIPTLPKGSNVNTEDALQQNLPPHDTFGLTYFVFLMLGVGVLFPWNIFLTAYDYFAHVYPDFPFQFALSLAYNYPSVLFLFLSVKFGPKFSFGSRIISAFALDMLVLIAVPIETETLHPHLSLWITLGGAFLTGCSTAILFGSVVGLSALFPPKYTGAVMSGNGIAGLGSVLLRIITKVSLPNTTEGVKTSAKIYFGLSAGVMLLCILSYFILQFLPIAKFYMSTYQGLKDEMSKQKKDASNLEEESLLPGSPRIQIETRAVFSKVWMQAFNVFLVFFVTISLFPGVTSLIQTHGQLDFDWFQIVMISIFMVGDYSGRTLPRWFRFIPPNYLWVCTVSRLAFFVFFILSIKTAAFENNIIAYIIMALFAVTNGYFGTLAMMYGPVDADSHEKEVAGTMLSFFLNFGIFLAVHFALLLLYIITGSIGIKV